MSFLDLFRTKKLSSVLGRTYRVKVQGVLFELRKVHPLDFINGSKAVQQSFATYKAASESKLETSEAILIENHKRLQDHYRDVFMAAVSVPKLTRKPDHNEDEIFVDHLFTDWDFAVELYEAIQIVTYGKKKMKSLTSLRTKLLKSTS